MVKAWYDGFALLEALIGTVILGAATLGIAALQAKLTEVNTLASQQIEAHGLLNKKMESLRNFQTLANYDLIFSGNDTVAGKITSYNRSWVVATTISPAYKTINLTISWTSSEGTNESSTFRSTIAGADPLLSGKIFSTYSPVLP